MGTKPSSVIQPGQKWMSKGGRRSILTYKVTRVSPSGKTVYLDYTHGGSAPYSMTTRVLLRDFELVKK